MMASGPAWLFCPADRPDRFSKAAARSDVVILDLEDAVAAEHKALAREAVVASDLDPDRTVVRVNGVRSAHWADDMLAIAASPFRTIVLAKCEAEADVIDARLLSVIPMIETPKGAAAISEIVRPSNVVGVMWGSEDLVAGLGGTNSRTSSGDLVDTLRIVRAQALLASKARGQLAIDTVYPAIEDLAGLDREARDATVLGYDAKAVIHPDHVAVVRDAFRPSQAQLSWATDLLAAARDGVFRFEGQMIDEPVLAQARRIKARA